MLLEFNRLRAESATVFAVQGSWGVGKQRLLLTNRFTTQVSHDTKYAGFPKSRIRSSPPHRFFMRRFEGFPEPSASANPAVLTSSSLPANHSTVGNTSSTTQILHLIPHRRNAAYFDSRVYLRRLTDLLIPRANSRTDTPCVGLFGFSGTGKTQHALEFAHRSRNDFDYIFWIDANSRTKRASSVFDIVKSVCPRPVEDANMNSHTFSTPQVSPSECESVATYHFSVYMLIVSRCPMASGIGQCRGCG
jgi:hypothetical protein